MLRGYKLHASRLKLKNLPQPCTLLCGKLTEMTRRQSMMQPAQVLRGGRSFSPVLPAGLGRWCSGI